MRVDRGADRRRGSFEVTGMGPLAFVASVRRAVAAMDLPVGVSVELEGGQLVISIDRLGRSVLRYDLLPCADGFTARLRSRRLAPLHLPFGEEYRETVATILERVIEEAAPR